MNGPKIKTVPGFPFSMSANENHVSMILESKIYSYMIMIPPNNLIKELSEGPKTVTPKRKIIREYNLQNNNK